MSINGHKRRTQAIYINIASFRIIIADADVIFYDSLNACGGKRMIGAAQLRGARALLGIDQRERALLSRLSMPTIQRMEASKDVIPGNVDSLMKLIGALDGAGIEFIAEGAASPEGRRSVRFSGQGINNGASRTGDWTLTGSRAA